MPHITLTSTTAGTALTPSQVAAGATAAVAITPSNQLVKPDGSVLSVGGSAPSATTGAQGLVQLAGDLGGTAAAPTVPGLSGKQPTLVSGTNIKTVGGTTILGSGDIPLPTASPATSSTTGLIQLAGDLGGTATAPTVPGLAGKQATLVSGTNIKTVGGTTLLGSGDIPLPASSPATSSSTGLIQLAGDLGGTATAPTVPGLANKQPTLVSGTNIKTVGGTSILGSGDIPIPTASAATTTSTGLIQLAGDLGGTATAPTVPGLAGKQASLVSGTNIKTVGGTSLLGSGDIAFPTTPAATTGSTGVVQLAGDLGGTATAPTVPGLANKQDTLVSGTNVKTIGGTSILGSGNIPVTSSSVTSITVARHITPSDARAILKNDTSADITLQVDSGVGVFEIVHGATNGIILTAGTGVTSLGGYLATSADTPRIVVTEVSTGIYRADPIYTNRDRNYMWIAAVGDSRVASLTTEPNKVSKSSYNWLNRALALNGQPGQVIYYGGISGQRTDQYDARVTLAATNPLVTDVFLKGGINNIASGGYTDAVTSTVYTATQTGMAAYNDMVKYITRLLAAGKRVWVEEEEGGDGTWPSSIWTSAFSIQAGLLNTNLEKWCQGRQGVTYIKWPIIMDRTSAVNKHLVGVKIDGTHDTIGGALLKAQYFVANYPQFPKNKIYTNPATSAYSTDNTNPNQLLENAGFTTRTGGTLGSGAAVYTAWASGATVAAGATRTNANGLYYTSAGGTTGATAPTHTTGSVSDGGVTWLYLCSYGAWAATTSVPAKCFRTNGGNLYYTVAGGTTGSTAPTHTSGTVSDGTGGVNWLYVMSTTNSIPQYWNTNVASSGLYAISTNVTPDNAIETVVLAFFTTSGSNAGIIAGSDITTGPYATYPFIGRQVLGYQYMVQATITIEDHVNLGWAGVRWSRGDLSNPPVDGHATSASWQDTKTTPNYAGYLGTWPVTETKQSGAFTCESQSTAGTIASWNDAQIQAYGAGVGFAIMRIRDVRMVKA